VSFQCFVVDRSSCPSRARLLPLLGAALALIVMYVPTTSAQADLLARARALHAQWPLVDGHNDFPWALRQKNVGLDLARLDISVPQPSLHTDIPRLRAGGVGMQFWSVYVPTSVQGAAAVKMTAEQIDVVHRMTQKWSATFELARTSADAERTFKAGKIASMIGMEGGHSIAGSLDNLRRFYESGALYMTLTHSANVEWADSGTDTAKSRGLAPFGEQVVREMNRLGMLVDLSHTSPETMADALRVSRAPVIFSHSSARAVNDHRRNVPDDILRLLPNNGGVVMVTFVPGFISAAAREWESRLDAERARLRTRHAGDEMRITTDVNAWRKANPSPKATLAQVADHIDHIRKVAGIDHVGLGGDFDGITAVVEGLEDVSKYPFLTAELLRRGYSEQDVAKVLGQNVFRAWKRAEQVAGRR
jgi:membrane dipeptidase